MLMSRAIHTPLSLDFLLIPFFSFFFSCSTLVLSVYILNHADAIMKGEWGC